MVIESLNNIKRSTTKVEVAESKDFKNSTRVSSKSDLVSKRFNKRNLEEALNRRNKRVPFGGITYIGDKFFTLEDDIRRNILHNGSVKYMAWRSSKTAVSIVDQCCFNSDIKPISNFRHKFYLVRDEFENIWFSTRDVRRVGVVKIDSTLGVSFFFTKAGWFYFSTVINITTGQYTYGSNDFNLDYEVVSSCEEMDNLVTLFGLFNTTGRAMGNIKENNIAKWRKKNDRNLKIALPKEKFLYPESGVLDAVDRFKSFLKGYNYCEKKISQAVSVLQTPPEDVLEQIVVYAERFFAFTTGISATSSISGAISVAYLYVSTFGFQRSISLWAGKLLSHKLTEISEGLQPQSSYQDFKNMFTDVQSVKNSHVLKSIVKIFESFLLLQIVPDSFVELCSTTGILKVSGIDITSIKKKESSSLDVIESLIESVLFVIDKVSVAVLSQNVTSLFIDNTRISDLDSQYVHAIACKDFLDNEPFLQSYDAVPPFKTANGYLVRLDELIKSYEELARVESKSKFTQTYSNISRKIILLNQIVIQAREDIKRAPIREQPFSLLISGTSGIGKTTIYGSLINHICKFNKISCEPRDRVTLNEADKFQSEVKMGTSVIIMDDLCNGTARSYIAGSPLGNVIKIINNVPCAAVKAAVHEKGQVYFNNKLTIATTNCPDLQARIWSIEPASVLRRFHYHIHTKLLPEYATLQNTLDATKLDKGVYTPAWEFDVHVIEALKGDFRFKSVHKTCHPLSLIGFLQNESKKHFDAQKAYVSSMQDMDSEAMCSEHNCYASICPFCKDPQFFVPENWISEIGDALIGAKRMLFPPPSDEECDDRRALLRQARKVAMVNLEKTSLILDEFSREYHFAINTIMVDRCSSVLELGWEIEEAPPSEATDQARRSWLCDSDISKWQESVFACAFDDVKSKLKLHNDERNAAFTSCVRNFSLGRSLSSIYGTKPIDDDRDSLWEEITVDECLEDYTQTWGWKFKNVAVNVLEVFWIKYGGRSMLQTISNTFKVRDVAAVTIAAGVTLTAAGMLVRSISPYARRFLNTWKLVAEVSPERGEENIEYGHITPRLLPTDGGFKSLVLEEIPRSTQSHSSTSTQFRMKLERCLGSLQAIYYRDGQMKASVTNAYPLFGTLWLVPNHSFSASIDYTQIILLTKSDKQVGKSTTEAFNENNLFRMPEHDLAILNIPSYGTVPSMIDYIATTVCWRLKQEPFLQNL